MRSLSGFASRIGLTGLTIAILIALLAVQTIRIEGVKVWPVEIAGLKARLSDLQGTIEKVIEASAQAAVRNRAARLNQERKYAELAERIDDEAEQAQADAMDAAERYIAANRVRCPAVGSARGRTGTGAESGRPASASGAGAVPELDGVLIEAEDVRICTDNTARLIGARNWASGLHGARVTVNHDGVP